MYLYFSVFSDVVLGIFPESTYRYGKTGPFFIGNPIGNPGVVTRGIMSDMCRECRKKLKKEEAAATVEGETATVIMAAMETQDLVM